jgi:hypothetical protein
MKLVVTATVATVTCSTPEELVSKIESLRSQLAKLPALTSGRKRSFTRNGLALEIPRPTWDDLCSLKASESHRAQLNAELDATPYAEHVLTPDEIDAMRLATAMSDQEIADRHLVEIEDGIESELVELEDGIEGLVSDEEYFTRMTKAQLLEHLTQHGHVAKKSWTHRQLVNAALDWVHA